MIAVPWAAALPAPAAPHAGYSGSSPSVHPSIHHLYVSLARQLAAHQAQRPAGASSASSHGVGYSAAVPDPERRILRQHGDDDSGGGQFTV